MTISAGEHPRLLPFRTAAVIGAGVMGGQIAAHLANAGLEVHLLDIAPGEGPKNAIVEGAFARLAKLKPPPYFDDRAPARVTLGNLDEHLPRLAKAEWVIEAIVEKLDAKQQLFARLEPHLSPGAIVSSNTSGISIADIAAGCSPSFRKRFLGTHFFNPPRYLELLELIPAAETDPAVVEAIARFARVHLGKGVVVAKDTPNFIANRVGVYSMMLAIGAVESGYTIEEIDALTGPLIGRPKSATFRTADVVGLDTLVHVARHLEGAVPHDESRAVFRVPAVLEALVAAGALGQKSGAGFYKKQGKDILVLDPAAQAHVQARPPALGDLDALKRAGGLPQRLRALLADEGRGGQLFRTLVLGTLAYAARRLPEIADGPVDVDRAMRWGFGWSLGPFETWDALGFQEGLAAMRAAGLAVPAWVDDLAKSGATGFYQGAKTARQVYSLAAKGFVAEPVEADEITAASVGARSSAPVFANDEGALHDMGDGVLLYEFRSKANALSRAVMEGLDASIRLVEEGPWEGLVVGNDGENFSVGANLAEIAELGQAKRFAEIGALVARFQEVVSRLRYARKPVVVAARGKTLGGGCEMTMACPNPVAAAETYAGLVELGVGLIPAGTGMARMAAWASTRAATEELAHVQAFVVQAFKTVGQARVAGSAVEAKKLGFLAPGAPIVMHAARRLFVAKHEVLRLARQGYLPPAKDDILVVGNPGRAQLEQAAYNLAQGRFASDYDRHLAARMTYVLTGGDLSAPQRVPEDYLLGLEREVFLSLLGEKKTHERIAAILTTGKPLRN